MKKIKEELVEVEDESVYSEFDWTALLALFGFGLLMALVIIHVEKLSW